MVQGLNVNLPLNHSPHLRELLSQSHSPQEVADPPHPKPTEVRESSLHPHKLRPELYPRPPFIFNALNTRLSRNTHPHRT